jgi:hypothetical protein
LNHFSWVEIVKKTILGIFVAVVADGSFYNNIFISIAAMGGLVTAIAFCICCYGQSDDDDLVSATSGSETEDDSKASLLTYNSLGWAVQGSLTSLSWHKMFIGTDFN